MFGKHATIPLNRGTFRRGYSKRRLFYLMELDQIAGKNVLDFGCGAGEHTVLHALYGAHAYGFDISSVGVAAGVRMAKANNVGDLCHFAVASASNLP
jgi:ubiquinone/menaquinone biosynthesis C-methylase UbiE